MILGIISDILEDVTRLREALDLLDREGCHEVACLGDIAGFSIPSLGYPDTRDASACLDLVRKNCKYIVAGNHDLFPARKVPVHNAGFDYPADWFSLDHRERRLLAGGEVWLNEEIELDTLLSADEKAFLGSLPEYLVLETEDAGVLLSHWLYPDLSGSTRRYYEDPGPVGDHLRFISDRGCRVGFSGHQHIEGAFVASHAGERMLGFGDHALGDGTQWVAGPCVANGNKRNGCMIFDSETFMLRVLPLHTPPRMMQVTLLNDAAYEK